MGKGCHSLEGHPRGQRVHARLGELSRAFVSKKFIVFYRDCDIPFQRLDFVRFHGASELLDEGTTAMAELAGIFLRHPELVVRGEAILFNAIALEMCRPNHELGCELVWADEI